MNYTLSSLSARIKGTWVALAAILSSFACGGIERSTAVGIDMDETSPGAAAIINGDVCSAERFPTAVSIIASSKVSVPSYGIVDAPLNMPSCTGTLIAPDVVLTAGHCVEATFIEQQIEMQFGGGSRLDAHGTTFYISFYPDQTGVSESSFIALQRGTEPELPADAVKATHWLQHENYISPEGFNRPGTNFNDVGLIFLEQPVKDVDPAIVITPEEFEEYVGLNMTVSVAGWGITLPGGGTDAQNSSGLKNCADSYIATLTPHDMQIGGTGTSPRKCQGDSGGPSYINLPNLDTEVKDRVIGVTSYGAQGCYEGGFDMRADYFYDWIDEKMSENCDNGVRSWCETSTILTPEMFLESGELDPFLGLTDEEREDVLGFDEVDGDSQDTTDNDNDSGDEMDDVGGCSQTSSEGFLLMSFLAFTWLGRRRK